MIMHKSRRLVSSAQQRLLIQKYVLAAVIPPCKVTHLSGSTIALTLLKGAQSPSLKIHQQRGDRLSAGRALLVAESGLVCLASGTYVVKHDTRNCHMGTSEMDKSSSVVIRTIALIYFDIESKSTMGRDATNGVGIACHFQKGKVATI